MKKYRKNAGIIVFNRQRKVLLCERTGNWNDAWQFPQGGIDDGETPVEAAIRELREETSVTSVVHVATMDKPLKYDFPPEVKKNNAKKGINHDGQEQYWNLFLFTGEDSEINLATKEREFKNWRWADIEEAPDKVVAFKKDVYRQVVEYFTPLIDNYKF